VIITKVVASLTRLDGIPPVLEALTVKSKPRSILKTQHQQIGSNVNYPIELVPISSAEYDAIPKYLKGRIALDKINVWVESLHKVFIEKYAIMRSNPARLNGEQRIRYFDWRDQDCEECRGQPFVTESDLKTLCQGKGPKVDSTGRTILSILRHCSRICEVRSPGIVRLVLN
jgi:hypothetical protein